MAPLKYEEHLKEKLEKRTLQPTEYAWSKLSNRLDNEEEKSSNKPYWWLGLAASIIGVLFVISQFFNNETKTNETINIVDTPEVIQQDEVFEITSEGLVKEDLKTVKDNVIVTKKNIAIKKTEAKNALKTNNSLSDTKIAISQPQENLKESKLKVEQIETTKKVLTFEEQKIQDVVAQVHLLKNNNKSVTEADIDALLQQAQKEIKLNRLVNETTGVVDANLLLQDVEAELDQSFRNKVFEAIKTSYNSVKTAVAQRND